jgi:hypothetical protein
MGNFFSLSKSATNSALNWSEVFLLLCGIILVVGIVGEESEKWEVHKKLFVALVIAGVAGELIADGGIFLFSHQLQVISDNEIADALKSAGDAKSSAIDAADAAHRAKLEADQVTGIAKAASSVADNAKAGAADAERQVASVRSEAASLKAVLDAEKEDLRRIRTARDIQDVSMGFIPALRRFPGTKYSFWTVAQDSDSLRIAGYLNSLLKDACGWTKIPRANDKQYDPLAMNIFRESNPPEYIPPERFSDGIRIFVNSPLIGEGEERSVAFLRKISGDNLPSSLAPAEALASALNKYMYPPEHTTWGGVSDEEKALGYRPIQVYAINGTGGAVVIISVGPKPL